MGLGVCTDFMKESWACSCEKDAKELAKYEDAHPEIFDPNAEFEFNVKAYNREGVELRNHTADAGHKATFAAETYLREPQIMKIEIFKVII